MKPSTVWRTGVAVAGGLALISGPTFAVAYGIGSVGPQVLGHRQVGDWLEVTVIHPGDGLAGGRLMVEMIVQGRSTLMTIPFTIQGGQKIFIRAAAPTAVERIVRVGIIVDDGAPF